MKDIKVNLDDKAVISLHITDAERAIYKKYDDAQVLELLAYFGFDNLAATTWYNKYADKEAGEVTPEDMHRRMAFEFGRIEDKFNRAEFRKITGTKEEANEKLKEIKESLSTYGYERSQLTEHEIFHLMHRFRYIIPQGSVMSELGTGSIGSLSNCFVAPSPHDSYGGIMTTDQHLAQIMKRRGGVGVDLGTLRPQGAPTSNVAKTSTGAVSFMERFSNTTREVAQGGRRGALMLSFPVTHPEVSNFVEIKQDLKKVTGANISVRISDCFMKAVQNETTYLQHWPEDLFDNDVEKKTVKEEIPYGMLGMMIPYKNGWVRLENAGMVWDQIVKAAHNTGEPGILFWSKVQTYGTDGVYEHARPISTNPCGEIPIPAYDSCRLIAMNILSFVENQYDGDAFFNYEKWYEYVYEALRLNDDLVELELEAVDRIINKIKMDKEPSAIRATELDLWENIYRVGKASRRTGLGFTALGDAAAALGLAYGSEPFLEFLEQMMKTKLRAEFDASIDLAITRGPFEGYDFGSEFTMIEGKLYGNNNFYQMLVDEFPDIVMRMREHGRRNISLSTVAPTGSLSMLAQVSSGMEPVFQWGYQRRTKINSENTDAIPDEVDANGDKWSVSSVLHEEFKNWVELMFDTNEMPAKRLPKENLEQAFSRSPWAGSLADEIDWVKRVEVQGMIQKYTTHSISSTINLPKDVSVEKVDEIYRKAWEHNLKGITVYRDGCRDGVLVTENSKPKYKFSYSDAPKRPKEVEAVSFTTQVAGEKYSVFVGLVDNIPYETFAYKGVTKESKGFIVKDQPGEYHFIGLGDDSRHRILTGKMTEEQEMITRLISRSLRHGSDIKFIVQDLQKASGSLFGFCSAIARVLKGFIPDGTTSAAKCQNPDCTGDRTNVIYEEGCHKCLDCGSGACG